MTGFGRRQCKTNLSVFRCNMDKTNCFPSTSIHFSCKPAISPNFSWKLTKSLFLANYARKNMIVTVWMLIFVSKLHRSNRSKTECYRVAFLKKKILKKLHKNECGQVFKKVYKKILLNFTKKWHHLMGFLEFPQIFLLQIFYRTLSNS